MGIQKILLIDPLEEENQENLGSFNLNRVSEELCYSMNEEVIVFQKFYIFLLNYLIDQIIRSIIHDEGDIDNNFQCLRLLINHHSANKGIGGNILFFQIFIFINSKLIQWKSTSNNSNQILRTILLFLEIIFEIISAYPKREIKKNEETQILWRLLQINFQLIEKESEKLTEIDISNFVKHLRTLATDRIIENYLTLQKFYFSTIYHSSFSWIIHLILMESDKLYLQSILNEIVNFAKNDQFRPILTTQKYFSFKHAKEILREIDDNKMLCSVDSSFVKIEKSEKKKLLKNCLLESTIFMKLLEMLRKEKFQTYLKKNSLIVCELIEFLFNLLDRCIIERQEIHEKNGLLLVNIDKIYQMTIQLFQDLMQIFPKIHIGIISYIYRRMTDTKLKILLNTEQFSDISINIVSVNEKSMNIFLKIHYYSNVLHKILEVIRNQYFEKKMMDFFQNMILSTINRLLSFDFHRNNSLQDNHEFISFFNLILSFFPIINDPDQQQHLQLMDVFMKRLSISFDSSRIIGKILILFFNYFILLTQPVAKQSNKSNTLRKQFLLQPQTSTSQTYALLSQQTQAMKNAKSIYSVFQTQSVRSEFQNISPTSIYLFSIQSVRHLFTSHEYLHSFIIEQLIISISSGKQINLIIFILELLFIDLNQLSAKNDIDFQQLTFDYCSMKSNEWFPDFLRILGYFLKLLVASNLSQIDTIIGKLFMNIFEKFSNNFMEQFHQRDRNEFAFPTISLITNYFLTKPKSKQDELLILLGEFHETCTLEVSTDGNDQDYIYHENSLKFLRRLNANGKIQGIYSNEDFLVPHLILSLFNNNDNNNNNNKVQLKDEVFICHLFHKRKYEKNLMEIFSIIFHLINFDENFKLIPAPILNRIFNKLFNLYKNFVNSSSVNQQQQSIYTMNVMFKKFHLISNSLFSTKFTSNFEYFDMLLYNLLLLNQDFCQFANQSLLNFIFCFIDNVNLPISIQRSLPLLTNFQENYVQSQTKIFHSPSTQFNQFIDTIFILQRKIPSGNETFLPIYKVAELVSDPNDFGEAEKKNVQKFFTSIYKEIIKTNEILLKNLLNCTNDNSIFDNENFEFILRHLLQLEEIINFIIPKFIEWLNVNEQKYDYFIESVNLFSKYLLEIHSVLRLVIQTTEVLIANRWAVSDVNQFKSILSVCHEVAKNCQVIIPNFVNLDQEFKVKLTKLKKLNIFLTKQRQLTSIIPRFLKTLAEIDIIVMDMKNKQILTVDLPNFSFDNSQATVQQSPECNTQTTSTELKRKTKKLLKKNSRKTSTKKRKTSPSNSFIDVPLIDISKTVSSTSLANDNNFDFEFPELIEHSPSKLECSTKTDSPNKLQSSMENDIESISSDCSIIDDSYIV
ncbi:hypothetical protein SNEBB_009785 [Seison nebaliae]|nr:hypothetical protein SNEBB_009785 [Seison nebaliae]